MRGAKRRLCMYVPQLHIFKLCRLMDRIADKCNNEWVDCSTHYYATVSCRVRRK